MIPAMLCRCCLWLNVTCNFYDSLQRHARLLQIELNGCITKLSWRVYLLTHSIVWILLLRFLKMIHYLLENWRIDSWMRRSVCFKDPGLCLLYRTCGVRKVSLPLQKVRHFSPRFGKDYATYTIIFTDSKRLAVASDELNWNKLNLWRP